MYVVPTATPTISAGVSKVLRLKGSWKHTAVCRTESIFYNGDSITSSPI